MDISEAFFFYQNLKFRLFFENSETETLFE